MSRPVAPTGITGFDAGRRRLPGQRGFSLVELMVALTLGLLTTAAAVSMFLANRHSYQANQGLNEVQSSIRTAFELMADDIRHVGNTPCGNASDSYRIANVVNDNQAVWWESLENPIAGFDDADPALTTGTGAGQRVAATPSLRLVGVEGNPVALNANQTGAAFSLNGAAPGWRNGDLLVICDLNHAAVFQLGDGAGTTTLSYATAGTPGNCSTGLGLPTVCDGAGGNVYSYVANAQIDRLFASDWYLGYNSAGGQSLFRLTLRDGAMAVDEIVRGATAMRLSYLVSGAFVSASAVTDWRQVTAVQIRLAVQGASPHAGTDARPIQRSFTSTVTLRNRVG